MIRRRCGAKSLAIHVNPIVKSYDEVGQMLAWEEGLLDEEEEIDFFQHLIDSGLVWQLQGAYGRTATALIASGACVQRRF